MPMARPWHGQVCSRPTTPQASVVGVFEQAIRTTLASIPRNWTARICIDKGHTLELRATRTY
jgi:hypothetical protein